MMLRGLRVVLLLVLVLLVGTLPGDAGVQRPLEVARKKRFECDGLAHREVVGPRPTYTRKRLADFRNDARMCRALWLPRPRRTFVPQGLALAGRSAWVTGYLYRPGYGERACRLLRVDLRTGALQSAHAVVGRVGRRPATYCRHGGGVVALGGWLWIAEKNRLWRVRPPAGGRGTLTASRVWRIAEPVRGSTLATDGRRIGLVPYVMTGPAHLYWYDVRALQRTSVLDLARRGAGRHQLGAVAQTRVPTHVQGATVGPDGRLYLTRSSLACGELVQPGRRGVAFVPGAEGIAFNTRGTRLWAVSESGAAPFARSRKPLTPALSGFEWPGLARGRRAECRF